MFGFIKNLFLPKKEGPKLSVEEEYNKILDSLDEHEIYYKLIKEFDPYEFDFDRFKTYVEESEYVTEYIREKTLKRLSVIKPLLFFNKKTNDYSIEIIKFFLQSEAIVLEETLNHIKLIKQGEKIIQEDLDEINTKINKVKVFIENTKNKFETNLKKLEEASSDNKKE